MKLKIKLDVVRAVKENSRDMFRDMPKQKRVGDKRHKKPKYPQKWEQ